MSIGPVNTTDQKDYQQNSMSSAEAIQMGQQSAQYGIAPTAQQPNESEAIYQQRIAAYEQEKQRMEQQRQQ